MLASTPKSCKGFHNLSIPVIIRFPYDFPTLPLSLVARNGQIRTDSHNHCEREVPGSMQTTSSKRHNLSGQELEWH
jgi:hypothetical protein